MNSTLKQSGRLGKLTTNLGGDKLSLLRFDGEDHLNQLFEYRVEALSTEQNINFDELLGTHATVTIETQNNGPRHFDGIVTQASWAGVGENGNRYNLTLRPWFWLAGKRRNQRIFHMQSVDEIITKVLGAYSGLGKPHVEMKLSQSYPTLEYTVQYRESDLEFVCRLMERFGISYFFAHKDGNHTLTLTDNVEAHPKIAGATREYKGVDGHHHADEEHFWEWHPERNITTGGIRMTDYNFKTPNASMEVNQMGDAAYEQGQMESYDYPGEYLTEGSGKAFAAIRTDQERGQDNRHRAVGDCTSLSAGMTLGLTGEQVPGVKNQTYVCLTARHSYVSDSYGSGGKDSDEYAYTGEYVLMPTTSPLAPPRVTPIPTVHGPQTATVVGKSEVDCDEYGRIEVWFHWDLQKEYSMRCRVSQNWAGAGWGGMIIPRSGMEVVVEYIEGNPDLPLVTGCVYNGRNAPPAELEANKTRSVFKTDSVGGEGFNELTFEDKAGEEYIYMHAQKNMQLHVLNSREKRVEFDDNATIGNNSNLAVAANRTETIDGEMGVTVKGNMTEKADSDKGTKVAGNYNISAGGDVTIKAGGEIVLDASKVTLVSGGAALVVQGGAVNAAPMLNVGSASPGAAALPAIPEVLKAAAGEGTPFVSHCPNA